MEKDEYTIDDYYSIRMNQSTCGIRKEWRASLYFLENERGFSYGETKKDALDSLKKDFLNYSSILELFMFSNEGDKINE